MKFTLSWLKDHLDTDASLDAILGRLPAPGDDDADALERGDEYAAPFEFLRLRSCLP